MQSQPRASILAARILGPLLLAIGAVLITQHGRILGTATAFLQDEALTVLAGFLGLAFGLTLVVLHPHWRTPTQMLISLIGVISLARGAVLLFAPSLAYEALGYLVRTPQAAPIAGCALALIGLWLIVFSFISPPEDALGYFN